MQRKILVINPTSNNDVWENIYTKSAEVLKNDCTFISDINQFFNKDITVRVLHINFIETIFHKTTDADIIKDILNFYKSNKTQIIVTRHDISNLRNKPWDNLYELVYYYADLVVHLGEYSLNDFKKRYDFKNINIIIPHPLYVNLKNDVTKNEARKLLNIKETSKVLLVFGNIRKTQEMKSILKVFLRIKNKNKVLLTTRVYFGKNKLIYKMLMFYFSLFKNIRLNDKNIATDKLQLFFNSSDLLFLPRIDHSNLNSGVLFLSLSYGLPIIGANSGVYGEVLKKTNQLCFDIEPISYSNIASKVDNFFENPVKVNKGLVENLYGFDFILNEYIKLYKKALIK